MNRNTRLLVSMLVIFALIAIAVYIGLSMEEPVDYSPVIDPADFVSYVDNEFFPLEPGTTYIFEGTTEEGTEHIEVNVTSLTRVILGVTCVVVNDTVWLNGEIVESTLDWYAQDKDGNVWYFGEYSREYSGGVVVSTEGTWEAGQDGAQPGIVMQADPAIGEPYRQEYYKGEAEDMAEVLAFNVSVDVTFGSFTRCLQTEEWTPLEPEIVENKYYAPGIGVVLEEMVEGGTDRVELIDIVSVP